MTKVTGLWRRESKAGQMYLSGSLNAEEQAKFFGYGKNLRLVILPNKYKKPGGNQPDFHLLIELPSEEKPEAQENSSQTTASSEGGTET